jgi:hypothetical protein
MIWIFFKLKKSMFLAIYEKNEIDFAKKVDCC